MIFAQVALGVSQVAFGGLNWALDGASAPVAAVERLEPAMAPLGALQRGVRSASAARAATWCSATSASAIRAATDPIFTGLDLAVPAGTSLAIVGQNGAGKTTLAKLLCRLYDPDTGEVRGQRRRPAATSTCRFGGRSSPPSSRTSSGSSSACATTSTRPGWRRRRRTGGARRRRRDRAGVVADLDTVLAKGYPGGTDLSGGQWQRVALARALCAVRRGAQLVLLDEPTAQLDVRGEAEVFDRVLQATAEVTTILISHRFSTVRHADRICVLEHGRVIELGSHEELMARGGRYRTMFDLQARRFAATMDEEGAVFDVLS